MSDAEVKEQLLNWRRLVAKWDRWTNRKKGRMGMGLKADLTGGKTTKGWAIECRHTEGIGKTDYHDCKKGWKRMYQENCSTVWTVGIWVYWVPQPHILVCWGWPPTRGPKRPAYKPTHLKRHTELSGLPATHSHHNPQILRAAYVLFIQMRRVTSQHLAPFLH